MEFKNPNNDYIESAGGSVSWLWVLLFGPFYWAVKGVWRHFIIHLFLALVTFGVVHFIYPFFVYSILQKHYLRMGWKLVDSERLDISDTSQLEKKIQQSQSKVYIAIGAVTCVVLGLGIGFYKFSDIGGPDPSAEIEEIIKRKMEEAERRSEKTSETVGAEKTGPRYYKFPGTLTANLMGSRKFLQIGIGITTDDDKVVSEVEADQLALRSEILNVISEFTEDDVTGKQGRERLSRAIADAINQKLAALGSVNGVDDVYFSSFALQ